MGLNLKKRSVAPSNFFPKDSKTKPLVQRRTTFTMISVRLQLFSKIHRAGIEAPLFRDNPRGTMIKIKGPPPPTFFSGSIYRQREIRLSDEPRRLEVVVQRNADVPEVARPFWVTGSSCWRLFTLFRCNPALGHHCGSSFLILFFHPFNFHPYSHTRAFA